MAQHITGPLYWEQLGKQGTPIAFVHPNPMDHSCWVYQMDHFSTWYRCVGIDLPGYGKSPRAEPGLSVADMAQGCWEAMDQVSDEPTIVVGLSVGWHIALHMAQQQPGRTLAILLTGCAYHGDTPKRYTSPNIAEFEERGLAARYDRILGDYGPGFRQGDMAAYLRDIMVERNAWGDVASIQEIFRALDPPDPEWIFDGLPAPVLIITGSEDGSHAGAFALQARIPGCELVTMEGAGHACNMERPWEWDAQALTFLRKHGLFPGDRKLAADAATARG
jgi:3-oxoadipate enol-lactonase